MLKPAEHFAKLIEESGVEMTPENVLRCIEFARRAMVAGECTVEAYYKAKFILLSEVECPSELLN